MSRAEAAGLLGVDGGATAPEVQRAYLRAARTAHPDLVPEGDEPARRAAAVAFDRLTRAREVLLTTTGPEPSGAAEGPRAAWTEGPQFRRVEGRGLGGSLVVLALLAFLLVALVSLQQGLAGDGLSPGTGSPSGGRVTDGP